MISNTQSQLFAIGMEERGSDGGVTSRMEGLGSLRGSSFGVEEVLSVRYIAYACPALWRMSLIPSSEGT